MWVAAQKLRVPLCRTSILRTRKRTRDVLAAACVRTYLASMYTYIYIYIYMYVYIYIDIRMYVYIYIYIYTYIYLFMCVYIYMFVYVHVHHSVSACTRATVQMYVDL